MAAETAKPYTQADFELALELARRSAVAIDNARLHAETERRGDAARALQYVVDGVVLVDRHGRPRYWNHTASRILSGVDGHLVDWQRFQESLRRHGRTATAASRFPSPCR